MIAGRRWILWAILAYAIIIAAVSWGLVSLYTASHDRLDQALGDRLVAVATTLATLVDADRIYIEGPEGETLEALGPRLKSIAQSTSLADITLSKPNHLVLFSTAENLKPGQMNDFWQLDAPAADKALTGTAAAGPLYRDGDLLQKSAHAPVLAFNKSTGQSQVVAVVTVSGEPRFFDSLRRLRRGAGYTGGAVLVVLVLMGVLLYRLNLSLERYRASILRQENLAAMGRMTTGIAHEIRNPLGIIRGAGQHLQRVLADAGLQDDVADFIPEEVDRLDHILAGYLAFGSDGPVADERFDLARIVQRTVGMAVEELGRTGVKLDPPPDLAETWVKGDPRRMQQVVLNLLLNARDAMPDGGAVAVALMARNGQATLTVTDTGHGLGGHTAEDIFTPFWTSKEKGSGLGLAMSRGIIEAMGGTLDLVDRPDGPGAVATVTLPLDFAKS